MSNSSVLPPAYWPGTRIAGAPKVSVFFVSGALAAALRLAVDLGPPQLERMGSTGAEWVLTNCGWPKVARETCAVYARWISELWISELSADLTPDKAATDLATRAEAVR